MTSTTAEAAGPTDGGADVEPAGGGPEAGGECTAGTAAPPVLEAVTPTECGRDENTQAPVTAAATTAVIATAIAPRRPGSMRVGSRAANRSSSRDEEVGLADSGGANSGPATAAGRGASGGAATPKSSSGSHGSGARARHGPSLAAAASARPEPAAGRSARPRPVAGSSASKARTRSATRARSPRMRPLPSRTPTTVGSERRATQAPRGSVDSPRGCGRRAKDCQPAVLTRRAGQLTESSPPADRECSATRSA